MTLCEAAVTATTAAIIIMPRRRFPFDCIFSVDIGNRCLVIQPLSDKLQYYAAAAAVASTAVDS